jgi:nucleotide-binding universal stress UspA family protein
MIGLENSQRGEMTVFKHILLPTDGSPVSEQAVRKGIALAKSLGARVTVVVVIEHFHVVTLNPTQLEASQKEYELTATRHATKVLEAVKAEAAAMGVALETKVVRGDPPYEEIVRTAEEEGCDLIAMASHGRRGVVALMLGSQTSRVVSHAKVPVLVLR